MKRICSTLLAFALCLSLSAPAFAAEGRTVSVTQSFPEVYMEGIRAGVLDDQWKERSVLSVNGTVYVPLKTVGLWMGAVTVWDQKADTVTITSTDAEPVYYSVKDLYRMGAEYAFPENPVPDHAPDNQGELLHDMTVTVNGQVQSLVNAQGETVYPLLFHDCVYLPVRSVAGWVDKQVLWTSLGGLGEVHIYDAPTQEDLDGVKAYLDTVRDCVINVRTILEGEMPQTQEEYLVKVRAIQSNLKTVWILPAPDFQGFMPRVDTIRRNVSVVLSETVDPHLPLEESSGAPAVLGEPSRLQNHPGRTFAMDWRLLCNCMTTAQKNTVTYFTQLEKWAAYAGDFLAMVADAMVPPAQPGK